MGQQLRARLKRRRRKSYLARKKELAKSGLARKSARSKAPSADAKVAAKKSPAKKPSAAKKAPAKPEAKIEEVIEQTPAVETVAEAAAVVESSTEEQA